MKPIETVYRGYRFRSRLEARWAVFFDRLGIKWEYEPQGYKIGFWDEDLGPEETRRHLYLPDFRLPKTETWVEIKGDGETIDWQLLAEAVDWGCGLPGTENSFDSQRGLLLLGPIPDSGSNWPAHPILQHQKGGYLNWALFDAQWGGFRVITYIWPWIKGSEYFDSSTGSQAGEDWVRLAKEGLAGHFTGWPCPSEVDAAYTAARQARFEHGESGEGHA